MKSSSSQPIWIGKRCDQGGHFSDQYLVSAPTPAGLQWLSRKSHPNQVWQTTSILNEIVGEGALSQLTVYDESWLRILMGRDWVSEHPTFNTPSLIELLGNKVLLRSQKLPVPIIPGKIVDSRYANYSACRKLFPGCSSFVVHGASGSACANISVIRRFTDDHHLSKLEGNQLVITPLRESAVPYNIHIIVGRRNCMVAPPSLQFLNQDSEGQLSYGGCDFSAGQFLAPNIVRRIEDFGIACGEWLRFAGYTGVAGIDFLVEDQDVLLVEINPRYQASTGVLNANIFRAIRQTCQSLQIAGRAGGWLPEISSLRCRGAMTITPTKEAYQPRPQERLRNNWDHTLRQFHARGVAVPPFKVFPRPSPTIRECSINEATA